MDMQTGRCGGEMVLWSYTLEKSMHTEHRILTFWAVLYFIAVSHSNDATVYILETIFCIF